MIKAIVFDLGGVITADVWERMFLDPVGGLATMFSIDARRARRVGRAPWQKYANEMSPRRSWKTLEQKYWREVVDELGIDESPAALIARTDEFVDVIPGMLPLLCHLKTTGIELGICSNNTEFWFARQDKKFGLSSLVDPEKTVLSCRVGASKSQGGSAMFEEVKSRLHASPNRTLFIDDRQANVESAVAFGMPTVLFPSHSSLGHRYLHRILREVL
jgi:HAD superfamily hydrolase (TIGR01509 family)